MFHQFVFWTILDHVRQFFVNQFRSFEDLGTLQTILNYLGQFSINLNIFVDQFKFFLTYSDS